MGGVKTHINNFELNLNSFLNMVYDVKYVSTGNTTEPQALFLLIKYEEICNLAFDYNNGSDFRSLAVFSDHVS